MNAIKRKLMLACICCLALSAIGCGSSQTKEQEIRREAAISKGHTPGLFEKDVHMTQGE